MSGSDDAKAAAGVKLTYDDYVLFPEDGQRHELIDGSRLGARPARTCHRNRVAEHQKADETSRASSCRCPPSSRRDARA